MRTQLNVALKCCLMVAVGLFVTACRKQATSVSTTDPTGVYTLVSVDGKPVPTSQSHEGATLQVSSGAFTIDADGTCTSRITFVMPSGAEATREVSATYTKDGSTLTMQWKDAGTTVGTLDGNTFTMDNEGMVFVYRK
jgi:heat shock protein HslJ